VKLRPVARSISNEFNFYSEDTPTSQAEARRTFRKPVRRLNEEQMKMNGP
jgi:hypothetical protein